MQIKKFEQIQFSNILFDSLFSLVLFFSMDSFLDIKNPLHFAFYLFSIIILIHWWLCFKAADDAFDEEVENSGLDLIIGIIELVFIQYIVLMARSFDYLHATIFLITLLAMDLLWAIIWRYIRKWHTNDQKKIATMKVELTSNIIINIIILAAFIVFILMFPFLPALAFISGFILLYLIYIALSFIYKIIDINIF